MAGPVPGPGGAGVPTSAQLHATIRRQKIVINGLVGRIHTLDKDRGNHTLRNIVYGLSGTILGVTVGIIGTLAAVALGRSRNTS